MESGCTRGDRDTQKDTHIHTTTAAQMLYSESRSVFRCATSFDDQSGFSSQQPHPQSPAHSINHRAVRCLQHGLALIASFCGTHGCAGRSALCRFLRCSCVLQFVYQSEEEKKKSQWIGLALSGLNSQFRSFLDRFSYHDLPYKKPDFPLVMWRAAES